MRVGTLARLQGFPARAILTVTDNFTFACVNSTGGRTKCEVHTQLMCDTLGKKRHTEGEATYPAPRHM
jgi:hypothetical protein